MAGKSNLATQGTYEEFERRAQAAISQIDPNMQATIGLLIDPDGLKTTEELRRLTVVLFRAILMGDIPIKLSPEIRAWCRELLPMIVAAAPKGPIVNVNGGNVLLQLIQQNEMAQVPLSDIEGRQVIEAQPIEQMAQTTPAALQQILTVPSEAVMREQLMHDLEIIDVDE